MKAVDTAITLIALAVLTPAVAFAPSTASRAAIRRSRGEAGRKGGKMRTYAAALPAGSQGSSLLFVAPVGW